MTCIVGFVRDGEITLGGDSAAASSHIIHPVAHPKVFHLDDMLVGYTTSFRMGPLLEHGLSLPSKPEGEDPYGLMVKWFVPALRTCLKEGGWAKVENNEEEGGCFLVGFRKRLFEVQDDFSVVESGDPFLAVGSGQPYAMGSLHASQEIGDDPEVAVRRALRAAQRFNPFVRDPFHVVRSGEK